MISPPILRVAIFLGTPMGLQPFRRGAGVGRRHSHRMFVPGAYSTDSAEWRVISRLVPCSLPPPTPPLPPPSATPGPHPILYFLAVHDITASYAIHPMEPAVNGHTTLNGATPYPPHNGKYDGPTLEQLERELPMVHDGQVYLGELVSRLVQTMYAELVEMAET